MSCVASQAARNDAHAAHVAGRLATRVGQSVTVGTALNIVQPQYEHRDDGRSGRGRGPPPGRGQQGRVPQNFRGRGPGNMRGRGPRGRGRGGTYEGPNYGPPPHPPPPGPPH